MKNLAELLRTGQAVRYEKEYCRKDGSRVPAEVCVQLERDAAGKPLFYFGFITDLTQRHKAQDALRESEALFRSAFEEAPSGMCLTGRDGRFQKVNRAMSVLLGYAEQELVGMRFHDVTHPEDVELSTKLVGDCLQGSILRVEMEKRYVHKTGRVVWGSVLAVPMRNAKGAPTYFVTHIQDITERKQAEAALQRAHDLLEQKVKERTGQLRSLALELTRAEQRERRRVAYVLHEDLLQSLAAVKIQLDGMQGSLAEGEALRSVRKAILILDDAIRVSRSLTTDLDPPVLRELGLVMALRWLADNIQAKFNLAVQVEAPDHVKVASDELRVFLFHAIREALFNVVKHAKVRTARVRVSCYTPDRITVEIGDEGCGFDPGTAGFSGWGLFSIRERAMLLGGEMQVVSAPGKGTCVTLVIPAGPS
jgi:PAS domain S-box-containing protein